MAGPVLRLEAIGLKEMARHFEQLPGVVAKAERRAFKRTTKWAQTQGLRAMARESNVAQSALKKSLRALVFISDGEGRVWFGTDPVKAAYAGRLRQTKKGARAGRHKFPDGFVATMKSGHTGIYMRQGKSRLPIIEQSVDVTLPESEFNRIAEAAESRLLTQFHDELEFYASKIRG